MSVVAGHQLGLVGLIVRLDSFRLGGLRLRFVLACWFQRGLHDLRNPRQPKPFVQANRPFGTIAELDHGDEIVAVESADAAPLIAEADWQGLILDAPRGGGGFGYDPYFWLPDLGKTAAELTPAEKNRLSHRGKAMLALREQLAAAL